MIAEAQSVVSSAEPPSDVLLPVEPNQPFPVDALKEVLQARQVKASDYAMGAGGFDLMFITPVLTHGVRYAAEQANLKEKSKRNQKPAAAPETINPLSELRNWEEYVGEFEPVVIVRARPKLVEGFLSAFSRGMAQSQGQYAGPAQMHFKTDFLKMRVYCGAQEVLPIHPGKVEHRLAVSNAAVRVNDSTYEGFYTFLPDALGPQCGTVRVDVFSEKEPNKPAESKVVSPKIVQRIWEDFAPYRSSLKSGTN